VNIFIPLSAAAMTLFLSACGSWEGFRNEQASRYVGKPVDQMYGEWGAPRNSAPMSNGGTYYDFRNTMNGGFLCEAGVWTDAQGTVTEISVGGQNGCSL
jgi:hypothetical protein